MKPLLIDTSLTLFSGASYTQYNLETGQRLTPVARSIAEGWAIPFRKIDAAVHWDADTVYFLNTMQVVRYRLSTKQVEPGYPKIIPFYWRGLWASDIDAVLHLDQQTYFFRREQYIRYDRSAKRTSIGVPQAIASFWKGLPRRVTGAIPLWEDLALFFVEDECYLYSLLQGKTVCGPVPFSEVIREGAPAFVHQLNHREESGEERL